MNNPTSTIESVLSSFGGLCVELDSPDLPEGASPLNQDVDFLVGAVRTRPGVSNVYSYTGNSQTKTPGLGTDINANGTPWNNPNGISSSSSATVSLGPSSTGSYTNSPVTLTWPNTQLASFTITVIADSRGIAVGDYGLVCAIGTGTNSTGNASIQSVTDTLGNTWTNNLQPQLDTPSGGLRKQRLSMMYAQMRTAVAPGGSFTITVTMDTVNEATVFMQAAAYVNVGGVSSVFGSASAGSGSSSSYASTFNSTLNNTLKNAGGYYLSIGAVNYDSQNSPGTSNTIAAVPTLFTSAFAAINGGGFNASYGTTVTGTIQIATRTAAASSGVVDTWTASEASGWAAIVIVFNQSSGAHNQSDLLQGSLYNFSIPASSPVTGLQVAVTGSAYQSSGPAATINNTATAVLGSWVTGQSTYTITVTPGPSGSNIPINVGDVAFIQTVTNSNPSPAGSSAGVIAVTDNKGNVWTKLGSTQTPVNDPFTHYATTVWYAPMGTFIPVGQSLIVTATLDSPSNATSITTQPGFMNVTGISATPQHVQQILTTSGNPSAGPINTSGPAAIFSFILGYTTGAQPTVPSGWATTNITPLNLSPVNWGAAWVQESNAGSFLDGWTAGAPVNQTAWGVTLAAFLLSGNTPVSGASVTVAPNNALTTTRPVTLTAAGNTVTLGGANDTWGQVWTASEINSSAFGFSVQAFATTSLANFSISAISITVFYGPPVPTDFNYIKSYSTSNGDSLTLALDAAGVLWQEDVQNTPDSLTPFFTTIEPNTFAVSCTAFDKEYIALSNLANGTDMPRQYNGRWVDRVSQVGPGAAPTVSFTATGYPISSITQPAAVTGLTAILWSNGPGTKAAAGNIITIYYGTGGTPAPATPADPNITVGGCVYLSGFPTINGQNVTGTYIVTSVQTTLGYGGHYWNTFCVQAGSSQLYDSYPNSLGSASYNATVATLTTTTPIPNVTAGSQLSVTGAGVSAWDATWSVTKLVNAAQLQITNTQLTFNSSNPAQSVATYNYIVDAGAIPTFQPTPGGQVTVSNTTNGNGIFNGNNLAISAVNPVGSGPGSTGTFSVLLPATANINSQAEQGSGFINGTQFDFEPGLVDVGTVNNPILGNSTGGSVTQAGNLGSGTRQAVVFFQTRNGYLTQPSAPVSFTLSQSANSITVSNVPIGPPNVIARCIAFTGANGANFFYIPQPVTVTINNQPTIYSATVINDNISTTATFTFTDAILLAATGIDIQGNDLFNQIELGSSLGSILYAGRTFWWGEQAKVPNFTNMSFDGGYLPTTSPIPAGWTVDLTSGAGGSLSTSPQFGNAYYIQNTTGTTQNVLGLIYQTAYQDAYGVPIIEPQTQYGIRVTASCPSGVTAGHLGIQLVSGSTVYGEFDVQLSSMSTSMQIFTGTLLATAFQTQPSSNLVIRVYLGNTPNGADVLVDRLEVFDLSQPNLSTQLRASYVNNPEAFDQNTGNLGVGTYNNQSISGAFVLHDNLYILKTRSMEYTIDNGTTEPYLWQVRQVSNKVGTPSIHGFDYGEEWAVIAAYDGLYVFGGGVPQKISQEIQPIWDSINWKYGNTIWVRNDIANKRVLVGVPIVTPNVYMPLVPANANPTSPNVILCMSYREVNSVEELANRPPIHLTYTGKLVSWDLSRKWTVWNVQAPYADFCIRPDTTEELLVCNGTGNSKIYQFVAGNYSDDGAAINSSYTTYGFVKSDIGQATGLGAHNMFLLYGTMLVKGSGNLSVTVLPNTTDSPYADSLLPIPLYNPNPNGDTELPFNENGNRFFVTVSTNAVGSWFQLSKMVLSMRPSNYPVRGAY